MTREEAIKKLQRQKAEYLDEWVDFSGIAEAYDMAIQALESTDCGKCEYLVYDNVFDEETGDEYDASFCKKQQPCDDCISRQATVERLCKVADFMNEKRNGLGSPYVMAALFIQDNKDEFPPVTPQPRVEKTTITDGDLIPRQAVIKMLNKIENAVEDGDGFQFNE